MCLAQITADSYPTNQLQILFMDKRNECAFDFSVSEVT